MTPASRGAVGAEESARPIVRHLIEHGYLDQDGGMLFIGPAAEERFGRRHFMEMTAVFTGPPEFIVLLGRNELGRPDPSLLTEEVTVSGDSCSGGRSWRLTYIDWRRRRCFVEPADGGGRARWSSGGWAYLGFELIRSVREVLLGADPPVTLTRRAVERLAREPAEKLHLVHPGGTLIVRENGGDLRWWTWAGFRANATLTATLGEVVDPVERFDDCRIRLRENVTPSA